MLLWFGIWQFLIFWEEENRTSLILTFLSLGLLLAVRIEAFSFLLVVLLLVFWKKRKFFNKQSLYLLAGIIFFQVIVLFFNRNFYLGVAKSFLRPLFSSGNSAEGTNWIEQEMYLSRVFSLYGILIILAFGILGIFYLWRKKKYQALIPIAIVLPSFIYLLVPSITLDHPWMLRRYAFSIYPAFLFAAVLFIDYFFKKKFISYLVFSLILLYNLFLALICLPFAPQQGISLEVKDVFSAQDLILVDRLATGDGYEMFSGPLSFESQKNSAYFFNPEDLGKINLEKFEKIYIIIPEENFNFYEENGIAEKLEPISEYKISRFVMKNNQLSKDEILSSDVEIPTFNEMEINGKIFQYLK